MNEHKSLSFKTIFRKIFIFFRREILRDHFLLEIKRWNSVNGDNTFRLNYPLDANSVIWDLGGYRGDFAEAILKKFGCRVYLFEPMPKFHKFCVKRFLVDSRVICLPFGLGHYAAHINLCDSGDASSFNHEGDDGRVVVAEIRPVVATLNNLGLKEIDLLKINIEGGEFDVMFSLIYTGTISQVMFLQVQYHEFIPGARELRDKIRELLARTHKEMWCFPFVWESWQRK